MTQSASIIIVTYNHNKYIKECLSSLISNKELEIIVVDNNSTDGTSDLIEKDFPQVNLIKNHENKNQKNIKVCENSMVNGEVIDELTKIKQIQELSLDPGGLSLDTGGIL